MKPKKFSVYKLIDVLLWTLILLLPLIFYAIYTIHNLGANLSFLQYVNTNLSMTFNEQSIIYVGIEKMFTNGFGFFDIFTDMGFALEFFVWFFFVEFMHLTIDFLVILPRMFHEWCYGFIKKGE